MINVIQAVKQNRECWSYLEIKESVIVHNAQCQLVRTRQINWLLYFPVSLHCKQNRGTQRQVSVDICSVEGSSPLVFGVDKRVHSDFRD